MGSDSILDGLNDEQRQAVETTEGFVRVVAGAGSGKTRALAHRFAYLVKRLGVLPGHILCVTFSNKSANEMRARIRSLVGDIGSGLVNTFHGFCAGVIREDGHCVGYPQNFPVLDNPDIDAILRTIYEERGLTMRDCTFSDARDMFEVRKTIKERGYCREMVELPLETLRARYRDASTVGEILFRGYVYYEKKCFALDYNDLILLTLQIFRDYPDVRRKWRERLEYVMIDEFQDVDPLQYELMETLVAHHRNLFVVGDPDQTIYSWRGANVKYLLDFDKRFTGVKTIVMNRNYRSTNEVLSVANSLIAKNAMRIEKNLVSMRGEGPRVLCRHAKNPTDEAEWIARKMRELHDGGVPYSAMAVIYRAHFVTRELETQLKKAEVPYAIYSGVAFYDRAEIKDALSYLRLVYSRDDLSFARAANVPRRNIGTRRMAFLRERAEEEGKTLYETLKSSLDAEIFKGTKARELVDLVERHQNSSERPSELLSALLDESGYEAMLRTEGSQTRLDNVSELKNGIVQYEAASGEECSVGEYLAHVALFTNRDADSGKSDRVKLMTVHTAKGLEFPHVFLCALDEGVLPSRKTESKEQMEEERRLAFVAVTRAERGLYLTSSGGCGFDGTPKFPSRFFLDIDQSAVDYVEPPREDLVASLRAKLAEESAPRAAPAVFPLGARVRHEVFGEGTVVATDAKDPICQVRFDRLATTRWLSSAALRAAFAFFFALAVGAVALLPFRAFARFAPITREEAAEGRAVCVTGAVTCVAYWQKNSCVIASPDDVNGQAIYVAGEHPETGHTTIEGGEIRVGDILEVSGRIVPMFFSPGIAAYHYNRLGRMELGQSPVRMLSDFSQGLLDNRRTRIEGVVTEVRSLSSGYSAFCLATRQGVVEARVRAPADKVRALSDAEVCVDGVAMSRYNHRAEFLGVRIEVDSLESVAVRRSAPDDAFSAKEVPLNAVMSWSPEGHDGHRRLVRGTVTASNPDGTFYMQKDGLAIRASADASCGAPEAGMSVDAVGFPEMIGGVGQLVGVIWRRSSSVPELPAPIEITEAAVTNLDYGADMTFRDYDCRLVAIEGRVYRIERNKNAFDMFLDVGGIGVGASVRGEVPGWLAREEEYEPMVRVRGIARLDTSGELANGHRPGLSSFSVEVPSPGGIALVPDGEWRARHRARTLQKSVLALAALLVVLMAVGVWALWRARTRERESRLLADERKRMAGDLHDTIEQHLAGAKILLSTAADKLGKDGPAAERAVKMAGEVLAEAKRQIRDVILNLRSDVLMRESAEALVAKVANELNARGIVRARVRLRGIPSDLTAGEKSDLVAIVQQAVTNAVNHGRAKNVAIVSDPAERTGTQASPDPSRGKTGFVLRILNDGEPFDAGKVLGPESGHFGLSNMRERAKRSGMAIEWCREGKWMCVKVEGLKS